MANVIPREGLQVLRKRTTGRFMLVGALVIGIAAIVAMIALAPAYLSVRIARAGIESAALETAKAQGGDQAIAQKTQRLVAALKPIANATTSPSELITTALAEKPTGISVTTITYTAGTKPTIQLGGTSARREAVNALRDTLEKSGRFPAVEVPVAALVGTQEGRFTITLSGF